jgi:hypothetical protein
MGLIKHILAYFRKQPTRTLPVDHVYTFSTGEKLYTYKPEHYGQASSRHYRNIQEAVNYLMTFQMARPEWIAAVQKMRENNQFAITETKQQLRTKALVDNDKILDDFTQRAAGLKNANQTLMQYLFCMFYLLEDEKEMGFSEIHNQRKIELLNEDPLMADFFLSNLTENMKSYFPISEENTLLALENLILEKERIYSTFRESLKKRTSTSESTQEAIPTS